MREPDAQLQPWLVFWSPEGRVIAKVQAKDAADATRQAPAPYRKYRGEIYAQLESEYDRNHRMNDAQDQRAAATPTDTVAAARPTPLERGLTFVFDELVAKNFAHRAKSLVAPDSENQAYAEAMSAAALMGRMLMYKPLGTGVDVAGVGHVYWLLEHEPGQATLVCAPAYANAGPQSRVDYANFLFADETECGEEELRQIKEAIIGAEHQFVDVDYEQSLAELSGATPGRAEAQRQG